MTRYLIVGGAGFIGINAAEHYARHGAAVTVLDNFSRRGTEENIAWLQAEYPAVKVVRADIRNDLEVLAAEAACCDVLLHLAAQVAVTTSVTDPRTDFAINALGTLNVLEAARQAPHRPIVLYSSTNKVYGGMENLRVIPNGNEYGYAGLPQGVNEDQPLDFHSPYGCSKGAGDQYVRDYGRIYGLRTVVFRQSCIYGPHQFGVEDQGWVAWLVLRSLLGKPVTIYGDGKQVRDVLNVEDLIAVYDAAVGRIDQVVGKIYNIGGGPANKLSLLQLIGLLEKINGSKPAYSFSDWRPGDQRVYISDVHRAHKDLDWSPKISPEQGVRRMLAWMTANRETILDVYRDKVSTFSNAPR